MKFFKLLLPAALLALAGNASALNLNLTTFGGPANLYIGQAVWLADSAVLVGALSEGDGTRDATYLTHGAIEVIPGSDIYLVYQMSVPVTATQTAFSLGPPIKVAQIDLAVDLAPPVGAVNRFKLGLVKDTNGLGCGITTLCQATGAGYGDGLAAAGLGLVGGVQIIAEGEIISSSASWKVNETDSTTVGCLDGSTSVGCQLTTVWSGAGTLDIDITGQDGAFVLSDLAGLIPGPDLHIQDVLSSGHDFEAPFAIATPSSSVVGHTPDFDGASGAGDTTQDFVCGSLVDVVVDFCDLQAQSSAQAIFNDNPIPEPGTVALAGLGLLMLGGRRKLFRRG